MRRITAILSLALLAAAPIWAQSRTTIYNTRHAVMSAIWTGDKWVAFGVEEDSRDLNGDGDTVDTVLALVDAGTYRTTLVGAPLDPVLADSDEDWPVAFSAGKLLIQTSEADAGKKDLNGNGILTDNALVVYDVASGKLLPTGVSGLRPVITGSTGYFIQPEKTAARDLNGDRDQTDQVLCRINLTDLKVESLNVDASGGYLLHGDWIAVAAGELQTGKDLNGDGDMGETVAQLYQISTGKWINTGLAVQDSWALTDHLLAVAVDERQQGNRDLNGNGQIRDLVLTVWDLAAAKAFSTGLDSSGGLSASGRTVAFGVDERIARKDLNNDRDSLDIVAHAYELGTAAARSLAIDASGGLYAAAGRVALVSSEADQSKTDFNGDGDFKDFVLLLVDLATNKISNLKVAVDDELTGSGPMVAFPVSEQSQGDTDLNADRDVDDTVLFLLDTRRGLVSTTGAALSDYLSISARACAFAVYEEDQGGLDLNGNRALEDDVLFIARFAPARTAG